MILNNALLGHQERAVEKLIRLKVGALFMEQGTGKTITTLELARRRYEAGKIEGIIWLCPCSAKINIKKEIIKQCPSEMLSLFTICGIETLSRSIKALSYLLALTSKKKCFLVVDESLLIKNPWAYRTEHIFKIGVNCPYKIILNGTPVSKNEADLFAQFYLLDWRILGYRSYWSFTANHLEYDEYGRVRRVLNTDYLAAKIEPYTFQVRKSECMELPDKIHRTFYFSLTHRQDEEYLSVAEELLDKIDEWKPTTVYRLFSGLSAVISGKHLVFNKSGSHFEAVEMFDDPLDNPRIACVMELLDEQKTIIYCKYTSEITQLCSVLPDAIRFDGSVSQKKRNDALEAFAGPKKYLVANANCAGYSLNLQFCHNIIYMSNDWDLGKRMQSEDRVHRYGQKNKVSIFSICAENTIDEKILSCLSKKEWLLESLKDEIENSDGLVHVLKKYVYGRRYRQEIFDVSELEETDA